MTKNKIIAFLLAILIAFYPIFTYATTIHLNTLLRNLTRHDLTTIQKMELLDSYKGKIVTGEEMVDDVTKGFASENDITIRFKKRYKGTRYDIILQTVDLETAKDIKKGKRVKFEGEFAGMTFDTLRFENVKIRQKSRWWPF